MNDDITMVGRMLCSISGTWKVAASLAIVMSDDRGDRAAEAERAALHDADHRDRRIAHRAIGVEHDVGEAPPVMASGAVAGGGGAWAGRRRNPCRRRAAAP